MIRWEDKESWEMHGEDNVLVEVGGRFYSTDLPIAKAAESATIEYLFETGLAEINKKHLATVYWRDGAQFGPFPVVIHIKADATCLRGQDET